MYHILFYDYVPDILIRRAPYRERHLALARSLQERGALVMAGAWNNPIDGAAFVFKTADRAIIEEFARSDPYVANGLVTAWRIREWNVVVGG